MVDTEVALINRWNFCDSECYMTSPDPICWESNVTNTTTLCYGTGNKCNENCWHPYKDWQNATIVGENETLCHELDNCDEIYAEEQLSVDDSR